MLANIFNFLLISVNVFRLCDCAPIGYIGNSDRARMDVIVDTQTDSGFYRNMTVSHQDKRFVKSQKIKSEKILQEDFVQIPDDMFITGRGMTEEVVCDSYHASTTKENSREKHLQPGNDDIDGTDDLESFNYIDKLTQPRFNEYDQQVKTVRVYLAVGYIFLLFIVIFVCYITHKKPAKPCSH